MKERIVAALAAVAIATVGFFGLAHAQGTLTKEQIKAATEREAITFLAADMDAADLDAVEYQLQCAVGLRSWNCPRPLHQHHPDVLDHALIVLIPKARAEYQKGRESYAKWYERHFRTVERNHDRLFKISF